MAVQKGKISLKIASEKIRCLLHRCQNLLLPERFSCWDMDIQHRRSCGVAAMIQRHWLAQNRWLELESANADDLQTKTVAPHSHS